MLVILIGTTSLAIRLTISAITPGIKKYKSMIKKKKKKHDKVVLLAKTKLISIEILISKALIDSNVSHDELVSMYNALKEYDHMKEEIKNLKTSTVHQIFSFIYKTMFSYCLRCRKNTESKNLKVER